MPPSEGVEFETVATDHFMVVGPRGHDALGRDLVPIAALTRQPFLMLQAYRPEMDVLSAKAAEQHLDLTIGRAVTNVSTLLGLVAAGLGLTLLPGLVLGCGGIINDSRFDVAGLEDVRLSRKYGIASLAGHDLSQAARAFAGAIRAEITEQTSGGRRVTTAV